MLALSNEKISKEDIDAVAAPILEAQVFEMTAAISKRDFDRAADILGTLLKLQEEPIMPLVIWISTPIMVILPVFLMELEGDYISTYATTTYA